MASMCRSAGVLSRNTALWQLLNTSSRAQWRCLYVCQYHQPQPSLVRNSGQLDFRIGQVRCMSQGRKSFFTQLAENIKQEFSKNKEMKESLKKFRAETEKLEQSDAIKKAREKFESIEAETLKSSAAVKQRLDSLKGKVSEALDEVQKTELMKKGKELSEELGKSAEKAKEQISRSGQQLGQTSAFRNFSQGVKAVKEEIDETALSRGRIYKAPAQLRKRSDGKMVKRETKAVEANEDATGMVLHKDSRFYQSWQNFKDNNPYVNKLFDLKMKYDESDHVMIRATRAFTDKVGQVFGGLFTKSEMSEVLTEICKVDPDFDKEKFVKMCEQEIIPNVLEAMIRGDLEVLKDWCHEAPFNVLGHPIKQALAAGYRLDSRVLDINNVDVVAGKIMEQGPVLVISFQAQQIMVVRDAKGQVAEGDPEKIQRIMYVWALCRDQEELDPNAAWKLMDISASASEQWL